MADKGAPVGERGARRVGDVLVGKPDRAIRIGHSRRVRAPARSRCPTEADVTGEAVLRSGTRARDVDTARAARAHRGIGRAWEDIQADHGEANERLPARVDANGWEECVLL